MRQARFLYVRHAKSLANEAFATIGTDSWTDKSLYDALLCEEGIQ